MNGRIVVVDDEPITRMDIRDVLEEAGYDVVAEASDGFEAIEACKNIAPI
ncbi:transcriptional regulatory protein pdtaR [Brochothrix thermosphacta DSM 20171 = FSL F6-1036]|nr:transcriptional regulatory protein pdtaR [Brochothrix thermosphacta DSM 20171 = FSL F6-1036]